MVVNEMTGLRSTAAAGAQGGAGVQLLGSRPFPRHTSALVPREGANGERRQLSERARWAREFWGRQQIARSAHSEALADMV
jgi:hypothetical protein